MELKNTINMSATLPDGESADVEYYRMIHGTYHGDLHLTMCEGDLLKICNVLHDYEDILQAGTELFPEGMSTGAQIMWDVYREQLRKIRHKIEKTLDYSVEEAIVKCEKKKQNPTKGSDVGEDAMVMAVKKSVAEAEARKKKLVEQAEDKKKSKKQSEPEQLSLVLE